MEELKFVLKCFLFTALLVVLMQVKVGGASIEAYSFHWLRKSTVSQYIQSVAAGGAMGAPDYNFGSGTWHNTQTSPISTAFGGALDQSPQSPGKPTAPGGKCWAPKKVLANLASMTGSM